MKRFLFILITFLAPFSGYIKGQNTDIREKFHKSLNYYNSGDLVKSEKAFISILDSVSPISNAYLIAIYNNLGNINMFMGKYDLALDYYNKSENFIDEKDQNSTKFADICNNKAHIFTVKKSYNISIEFLEKSIRIYTMPINKQNESLLQSLSSAYLNLGIVYSDIGDYNMALNYFAQSTKLKQNNKLKGLPFVYLNIAKTYVKTNNKVKAEEYFIKSLNDFEKEYGTEYYRTASVLFDYAVFLRTTGKFNESLKALKKALTICLKNYGEKHTVVSLTYKLIGDHYISQSDCDSALFYYQKALIAVASNYYNTDIFSNPSIDSALFDIRLLDNLKSKALALEKVADKTSDSSKKLSYNEMSLETIELAMELIDRIRNNFPSEESRIYLAENEKETYLFATHIALNLFDLTKDKSVAIHTYEIAAKAKASVLRNEIIKNEIAYSIGIPDSLKDKQNQLSDNISAYNNLIREEAGKPRSDSAKIILWKDAVFDMKRKEESLREKINSEYPQLSNLLHNTDPVTVSEIQNMLGREETVIDYLLSNKYENGSRKLYIFLITHDALQIYEEAADSSFRIFSDNIRNFPVETASASPSIEQFRTYTASLYYMYDKLFRPFENEIKNNRIIIIPDEEISWLPFDALIREMPQRDQTDFEGLKYLLYDYAFSYGYSSSLLVRDKKSNSGSKRILAFSPTYDLENQDNSGFQTLSGASHEIDLILKRFSGKKYTGEEATEQNFKNAIKQRAVFHLAMHSLTDSTNSDYSYLAFDSRIDSLNDGKLYNYEISISRVMSPMIVLSSCNSGSGTLYHGEGLMSMARAFILAGASSVIKTAWEVNDETSAAIIESFYLNISRGMEKDEALRLAKLDFIRNNPPIFSNPYYWASYEVLGDNRKLERMSNKMILLSSLVLLILTAGFMLYYLRRRKISSARPE